MAPFHWPVVEALALSPPRETLDHVQVGKDSDWRKCSHDFTRVHRRVDRVTCQNGCHGDVNSFGAQVNCANLFEFVSVSALLFGFSCFQNVSSFFSESSFWQFSGEETLPSSLRPRPAGSRNDTTASATSRPRPL